MSKVYFSSDLHLGHKNILNFSKHLRAPGCSTADEHDEWLIDSWNSVVKKRDIVYVLGDVAMGKPGTEEQPGAGRKHLEKMKLLNGTKKVVLGNHDDLPVEEYMKYFQVIRGMDRYRGFWITHAPIHPFELRGFPNIHGHTHQWPMPHPEEEGKVDSRYKNVCVEQVFAYNGTVVLDFEEIRQGRFYNKYLDASN